MEPRLDRPGAGVPWWQRLAGKYVLLPWACARLTWASVPDVMEGQARQLLRLGETLDEEARTRCVLIRPQIGLEDSSRYYSWAMVLEHLTITGRGTMEIVVDLIEGRAPSIVVRTADLKARGGRSSAAAIAEYQTMLAEFRRRTQVDESRRRSALRHEHPWFGPLDVYQWLCFAPFHQTLHVRQARAIVERLRPS